MIIDGIEVPDEITNPEAIKVYLEAMRDYSARVRRAPEGLMGGEGCLSGEQYFAYQVAMRVQNSVKLKSADLSDLVVGR